MRVFLSRMPRDRKNHGASRVVRGWTRALTRPRIMHSDPQLRKTGRRLNASLRRRLTAVHDSVHDERDLQGVNAERTQQVATDTGIVRVAWDRADADGLLGARGTQTGLGVEGRSNCSSSNMRSRTPAFAQRPMRV